MIINWNAGELLGKSVVSLKSQRYRIDEMIVVDNASTDSSTQDLDKLLPGIKIIHLGKNMGFAAANNVAARAVKSSKWLALTRYGGGFF